MTKTQSSGERTVTATLTSASIGAGLLALSFTTIQMGQLFSFGWLIVCSLFAIVTYKAIVDVTHALQVPTFRHAVAKTIGPKAGNFFDFVLIFMFAGFLIAYSSVASQYILSILNELAGKELNISLTTIKIFVSLLIFIPLSLPRSIEFLGTIGSLAIICITVTVGTVAVKALTNETHFYPRPIDTGGTPGWESVLRYAPMTMALFSAQGTLPNIYSELQGPPTHRRRILNHSVVFSTVICGVLYMTMAVSGSSLCGTGVKDNILVSECFQDGDVAIFVCKIMMWLVIVISYPTVLFPMRQSILQWTHKKNGDPGFTAAHVTIGVAMTALVTFISVLVPSISDVFSLTSSLGGLFVFWIIPYYFLVRRKAALAVAEVPGEDGTREERMDSILVPTLAILVHAGHHHHPSTVTRARTLSRSSVAMQAPRSRSQSLMPQTHPSETGEGCTLGGAEPDTQRGMHAIRRRAASLQPHSRLALVADTAVFTPSPEHSEDSLLPEPNRLGSGDVLSHEGTLEHSQLLLVDATSSPEMSGTTVSPPPERETGDDLLTSGPLPPMSLRSKIVFGIGCVVFSAINLSSLVISIKSFVSS
eukprot:gnl/Dysnectes_brevis/1693_a1925_1212.p1 GENE.gnl/Dysnectes_brevis/1693_a1925_1212~~gnl/Dysnectes_brevis/1693_a1925_1212.p1  ORF type:complete len:590 (+),score=150.93 gnl/Dysnectes_brevis/1693_a1925_1212:157-1926(+)